MRNAALALLVLILAPGVLQAATGFFDSLEMTVLRSERIALIQIQSSVDSAYAPPAMVGVSKIRYRVLRNLRGEGQASGTMRVDTWQGDPRIQAGDSVLWLRRLSSDSDDPEEPIRREDVLFDLSGLERTPYSYALTRDCGVLRKSSSILAAVTHRMRMIRSGAPLGDSRRYSLDDFARGLGAITTWMDPESEAEQATYGGSINILSYPADADLLPKFLEQTRSRDPGIRAFAAGALASYPTARARLRELLSDRGTQLSIQGSGGRVDSLQVPIVRNAARGALRAMDQRKPFGWWDIYTP